MRETRKGTNRGSKNLMYGRHETAPAYGMFGKEHPASKKVYQYNLLGNFIKEWDCLSDAQRHINILVTHITACCNDRQKTTGSCIWKRQFNARLKLDRERLTFDKDKAKTDAELKRQHIKKSSKTSSK